MNTTAQKFRFKVLINGKSHYHYTFHRARLFLLRCRQAMKKFLIKKDSHPKFYLWVGYEKGKDVWGKTVEFYNDGYADNEKDFLELFEQFIEK